MFQRIATLPKSSSFFLFGARGVGKSTLLRTAYQAKDTHWIDLLDPERQSRFVLRPSSLVEELDALPKPIKRVVIDEVQRAPQLLDVVHQVLESKKRTFRFVLTGSSARKLKAGAANLLAGRASVCHMFPLLSEELASKDANSDRAISTLLQYGSLPVILQAPVDERAARLRAYAHTYLQEEVAAEQLVRKLDPFRRFLPIAAQSSGEIVNYANISRDVGVDAKTIQSYYTILEDTLVGFFLEPWHESVRKRQRQAPKFYFFDTGVCRALASLLTVVPEPSTSYFGSLFESRVVQEIVHRNQTLQLDLQLGYLRTDKDVEVDLVIRRPGGIVQLVEIKSTRHVKDSDLRHLRAFDDVYPQAERYVLSRDTTRRNVGNVRLVPWLEGIEQLTPRGK